MESFIDSIIDFVRIRQLNIAVTSQIKIAFKIQELLQTDRL